MMNDPHVYIRLSHTHSQALKIISIFCGLYCLITISGSEFLGNGDKTGCIVFVCVFFSFLCSFFQSCVVIQSSLDQRLCSYQKGTSPATDYTACSLVLSHSFLPSSLYSTGYTFTDSLSINVQAVWLCELVEVMQTCPLKETLHRDWIWVEIQQRVLIHFLQLEI